MFYDKQNRKLQRWGVCRQRWGSHIRGGGAEIPRDPPQFNDCQDETVLVGVQCPRVQCSDSELIRVCVSLQKIYEYRHNVVIQ